MRILVPLVAIGLAACSGQPENMPDTSPTDAEIVEQTMPAPTTLQGGWRVAGIDGEPFDEPYGLGLMADETEIWWEPRCARMVRSYAISGDAIEIGTPPDPPAVAEGVPPPPVCTIGIPPRLTDVVRALDNAERIERTPANGVRLSGGGHSVTLFTQ